LEFAIPDEKEVKKILAQSYCEGNLVGVAPDLHIKCEEIFNNLDPNQQEELRANSDETKIAFKWKKIKLFRKEDLQDLKRLKVEMGLVTSRVSLLWRGMVWLGFKLREAGKWILLKILDGAYLFGNLPFKKKFVSFTTVLILIVGIISFKEVWFSNPSQENKLSLDDPVASKKKIGAKKGDRVFTVQIAAVNSATQANKLVNKLKRKKIDNLYVVKSKRRSGGHWYKLRVGKFPSKREASEFANQLVAAKTVKTYFIISLPKK